MKNLAKLLVVGAFALVGLAMLVNQGPATGRHFSVSAQEAEASPTPPEEPAKEDAAPAGERKIPSEFILGQDSVSEYGEAPFNHDNHAFKNYSPDGKSVVACIACHHTDQPKSSLKPPLVTSERDQILTLELYKSTNIKISGCRDCHFQDGAEPDDKEMPTLTVMKDGFEEIQELNNEIAYHLNCNTCHDEAAKLRPEVRKTEGFATTKDCNICHVEQ